MKSIERVQTGVRLEKRVVKVMKAVAELKDITLSDLIEGVMLHAFEGKAPFSADSLDKIDELKRVYALDLAATDSHLLREENEEFVIAFENCELDPSDFHHREHVWLAWIYLDRESLPEAMLRYINGLRRFTRHVGAEMKYHETITCAFLSLIHERMAHGPEDETWEAFAERNPDLLNDAKELLARYYSQETLESDFARKVFVLPDPSDAATHH